MFNKVKKFVCPISAALFIFIVDLLAPQPSFSQINKEAHKWQWDYWAKVARIGTYRDPNEYTSSTIIVGIVA